MEAYREKISDLNIMTEELRQLSRNLWWTWNPDAQEIFAELSPLTWSSSNHNAVVVLNSAISRGTQSQIDGKGVCCPGVGSAGGIP